MREEFKIINPNLIKDNVFKLIGADSMLITAGKIGDFNTMTASWGGLGVLWNKKVCYCVIRPQRYTYSFMERYNHFTLSFFEEKDREILKICGSTSGREVNKAEKAGLTPVSGTSETVFFSEARLVLECKKNYFQDLQPENFLDPEIEKNYLHKDYHRMYVGEIIGCRIK